MQTSFRILVILLNTVTDDATYIWYSSMASTNCPQESKSVPFVKLACHFWIVLLTSDMFTGWSCTRRFRLASPIWATMSLAGTLYPSSCATVLRLSHKPVIGLPIVDTVTIPSMFSPKPLSVNEWKSRLSIYAVESQINV